MINLLPISNKEELKEEESFRMVLILGTIFLFFLISLILVLLSIKIYLQSQLNSLEFLVKTEEKTIEASQLQNLRKKIISASNQISQLEVFYKNQIDLVATLEKIFREVPSEISLTSLSWQKETGKIILSGFSPSRELLFSFKNNLEKEPDFGEIYFPPQTWIKATNISFELSFIIKIK